MLLISSRKDNENMDKIFIDWFTVKDLNDINSIIKNSSDEYNDTYLKSAEQIISITPDISDSRNYLVIYKML